MREDKRLLEIAAELNKIRDRLYLDVYQIINELQVISSEINKERKDK